MNKHKHVAHIQQINKSNLKQANVNVLKSRCKVSFIYCRTRERSWKKTDDERGYWRWTGSTLYFWGRKVRDIGRGFDGMNSGFFWLILWSQTSYIPVGFWVFFLKKSHIIMYFFPFHIKIFPWFEPRLILGE